MAILKINGVNIPDPSSLSILVQDIDSENTTRNAAGEMMRDRVCGGAGAKRKLKCEWSGLDMATTATLHQAIGDEFFSVTYPDTYTGQTRTATMYVGDRSSKVYRCNSDGSGAILETVKANFIEK